MNQVARDKNRLVAICMNDTELAAAIWAAHGGSVEDKFNAGHDAAGSDEWREHWINAAAALEVS